MENDRKQSFVGERLVRLDQTTMMAHPLTYDEIIQRADFNPETTLVGQDAILTEISGKAKVAMVKIIKESRQAELEGKIE